jgi:hypothetical protein
LDTLLPGYCPWEAGGHTPTQRRGDAKTQSVRRDIFYEMDLEDTSIRVFYNFLDCTLAKYGLLRHQFSKKVFMFL